MDWIVEFYRDSKGKEPVAEFLNSLPINTRAKIVRLIDLLSKKGVLLKEPYTKKVKGKIREIRVKDKEGAIRVLYFSFTGKKLILLHGIIKKTNKTPKGDIEIAEKRMINFLQRCGGRHERKDFE
jgi:phage-related protein